MTAPGHKAYDDMGDEPYRDAGGNRKGQRHQDRHQHHRHGGDHVIPVEAGKWRQEPGRDKDKRRRGGKGRD